MLHFAVCPLPFLVFLLVVADGSSSDREFRHRNGRKDDVDSGDGRRSCEALLVSTFSQVYPRESRVVISAAPTDASKDKDTTALETDGDCGVGIAELDVARRQRWRRQHRSL